MKGKSKEIFTNVLVVPVGQIFARIVFPGRMVVAVAQEEVRKGFPINFDIIGIPHAGYHRHYKSHLSNGKLSCVSFTDFYQNKS